MRPFISALRVRSGLRSFCVVAAVISLTACGGASESDGVGDSEVGTRPVELDESRRLAETLFNNYELGGAEFDVQGEMPDGTFVRMSGEVDWVTHTGFARVDITGTRDAVVAEVLWGEDIVLELIPALTERSIETGGPSARWFARPPDVDGHHLDAMIELVTALASEQRGNPGLIAQAEGTAWLRSDTVPGTDIDVDVFRFGQSTRYWLEADGVRMYRFEGNNSSSTRPVLIDLRDHGPRTTPLPLETDVVDLAQVAELDEELVASG